ncbi:tRNA1(Val) (adenine(37)-N6)-methyltransferase [Zongyangia hominis]|uniref:Methyltransferase n=1 Tax=Zongyangia hominis TaxID=2763677 RepID=A0A926EGM2_9FIRM|nr:methyltransferase [Zongyangia hominis]MBC8571317.1 methyltransferase [Zongyangia hominis]
MEEKKENWEKLSDTLDICVTDAHKFGTDAFLLSHFAGARRVDRCADLGTGCGIVALLWYRRREEGPRHCTCVDIQEQAVKQLCRTVERAGLGDKIRPLCRDLRELGDEIEAGSLDLITCNPPYKTPGTGVMSREVSDQIARHEVMCGLDELCAAAERYLKFSGRLCLCQRPERLCDVICAMRDAGIEPKRLRFVVQRPGCPPWLFLIEGKKGAKPFLQVERDLIIEGPGGFSREVLDIYHKKENKPQGAKEAGK